MAALLSKFRIDYSDVIIISDVQKKAQDSTNEYFNSLIQSFCIAGAGGATSGDHGPGNL